MKFFFYLILVLLLVPLQTTLLPHLSVWNIKPDLGLVAACAYRAFCRRVGRSSRRTHDRMGSQSVFSRRTMVEPAHEWRRLVSWQDSWGGRCRKSRRISLGGMLLLVSLVSGLLAAIHFKGLDIISDVVDGRVDCRSAGVF